MIYAPIHVEPVSPMISPFTPGWGAAAHERVVNSDPGSATWESAALAVYMPIFGQAPLILTRVWWANGATVSGGATIEVGVYRDAAYKPGAKIISGSATQGTASQVQFVDVTDTFLIPGLYWIAVVSSSATNTTMFRGVASALSYDAAFRMEEASASPLPATATPVELSATNIYLCGFSTTTIT